MLFFFYIMCLSRDYKILEPKEWLISNLSYKSIIETSFEVEDYLL
jgi:hypothetical protein